MKSRILTGILGLTALAALAVSNRLPAHQGNKVAASANLHLCKSGRLEAFGSIAPAGPSLRTGGRRAYTAAATGPDHCFRNCRHYGYCEVTFSGGKLLTDGLCVSHNIAGFCDIQPSSSCPNGAFAKRPSFDSCGGLGSDEVDLARTCSF